MADRKLLKLLEARRKEIYANPDSVLAEYDALWAANGIYRSHDIVSFRKNIKGHTEVGDEIVALFNKAKLENERIAILFDLHALGYEKDKLVEIILSVFYSEKRPANLWEYADLLYEIKDFRYLPQYLDIIQDASYKEDRQMLILLVGKSKKTCVVPILIELLNDSTVYGHALEALSHFSGEEIEQIMCQYTKCEVPWIRRVAEKYLKKRKGAEGN